MSVDELNQLTKSLSQASKIIKKDGVIVVISFHSLEDNIVKNFFRPSIKSYPKDIPLNTIETADFSCIGKKIRPSKNEIEIKEVEYENEKNRFFNNIENLKDSVEFVEEDNVYVKSLLRVREGELQLLDKKLNDAKINIQELADKLDENVEVKNIYVTDVSSEIVTNDVMTNIERDSVGNIGLGIKDSNKIYKL